MKIKSIIAGIKPLIHSSMAFVAAISLCTTADVLAQQIEPFTYRAPLDSFKIHQVPDFLMHVRERSDFVIQRGVFTPGVGGWHTHPGPSFAIVVQGHIKLQIFTEKEGCFETPVYGPGDVYVKPANQLHRAIVVGEENEVEMIVRFNFPEGGPIGIPGADPGCEAPTRTSLTPSPFTSPASQTEAPKTSKSAAPEKV